MFVAALSRRCSLFFMVCFEMHILFSCCLWNSHPHLSLDERKLFIYAIRYKMYLRKIIALFCKVYKGIKMKVIVFNKNILASQKWLKQFSWILNRCFLSFINWTDMGKKIISSSCDEFPLLFMSAYPNFLKCKIPLSETPNGACLKRTTLPKGITARNDNLAENIYLKL